MIGAITAKAGVTYRGVAGTSGAGQILPIPAVTAISAIPPERRNRPRGIVYGQRGMLVDRVA